MDKTKTKCVVMVKPVLMFETVSLALGASWAVDYYHAMQNELSAAIEEISTEYESIESVIKGAMNIRAEIISTNTGRVVPILVDRIVVFCKDEIVPDVRSLQASSYYEIPVFFTQKVISEFRVNVVYNQEKGFIPCRLGNISGYYYHKPSEKVTTISKVENLTHAGKRYVICTDASDNVLDSVKSISSRTTYGELQLISTTRTPAINNLVGKYVSGAINTLVIHSCRDVVTESNSRILITPGTKCVLLVGNDKSMEGKLVYTECVFHELCANKDDFSSIALQDVGELFMFDRTVDSKKKDK